MSTQPLRTDVEIRQPKSVIIHSNDKRPPLSFLKTSHALLRTLIQKIETLIAPYTQARFFTFLIFFFTIFCRVGPLDENYPMKFSNSIENISLRPLPTTLIRNSSLISGPRLYPPVSSHHGVTPAPVYRSECCFSKFLLWISSGLMDRDYLSMC